MFGGVMKMYLGVYFSPGHLKGRSAEERREKNIADNDTITIQSVLHK